jgi:hypothetical protein
MSDRLQRLLISVILLMVIAESVVGLLQTFDILPSVNNMFKMTGTFKNPGPFGGFVAVGLAIVIVLLDRGRVEKETGFLFNKIISLLALAMGVIVLPASMSRAAWLALFVSLLSYAFIEKNLWPILKKRPSLICILLVGVLILSFATFTIKRESALGRLHIWNIACKAIAKSPIIGYGNNTFLGIYGDTQAKYFSSNLRPAWTYRVAGSPEYAFNEYLKIGVEYGLPIMLLFILLLLFMIGCLLKHRSPMGYGVIALCVFAFFSYPLSLWQFRTVLFLSIVSMIANVRSVRSFSLFFLFFLVAYVSVVTIPNEIKKKTSEKKWLRIEKLAKRQGYTSDVVDEYNTLFENLKGNYRYIYAYGMALRKSNHLIESNMVLKYGTRHSADPMFYNAIGDNYKDLEEYDKAENAYIYAHLSQKRHGNKLHVCIKKSS